MTTTHAKPRTRQDIYTDIRRTHEHTPDDQAAIDALLDELAALPPAEPAP